MDVEAKYRRKEGDRRRGKVMVDCYVVKEIVCKTTFSVICIRLACVELSHPECPFKASPCLPLVLTLCNCCSYMKIAVYLKALTTMCNGAEITGESNTLLYRGQHALQLGEHKAILVNKLPPTVK